MENFERTTDEDYVRFAGLDVPADAEALAEAARQVRLSVASNPFMPRHLSAQSAWWSLYHARCDLEREYEQRTGLCSCCGESLAEGDHDSDTEEAYELGQRARNGQTGIYRCTMPGTNIPMSYVVSASDDMFRSSYGAW